MLQLVDGPCQGTYMVKRAPLFLRAVKDKNGKTDVLDQIEDTPEESEAVYVYQRDGAAGWIHINAAKVKGYYAMGNYRYMPEIDGESLRDNKAWQDWATAHQILCPVDVKPCDRVVKACCSCPRNKSQVAEKGSV